MRNKVLFFFIFISGWVKGQQGGFEIEFTNGKLDDNTYYQLVVLKDYDSVDIVKFNFNCYFTKDYLDSGDYTFYIYSEDDGLIYHDTFSVLPGKITYAKEIFNKSVQHYNAQYGIIYTDSISCDYKTKYNSQILPFFYGTNLFLEKDNPVKNEFGIGFSSMIVYSFSKYIGILYGPGIQFSQSYFTDDSSLISLQNRFWERYSGLSISMQAGFRISYNSLQEADYKGILLDGGIKYYFPVLFRHTAVYSHKRISSFNIHQYTDVRAFVNIGVNDGGLFFEYRITDFISGNRPESPKFRIGINFFLY